MVKHTHMMNIINSARLFEVNCAFNQRYVVPYSCGFEANSDSSLKGCEFNLNGIAVC
jgi:hypothetical protein